MAAAEVWRLLVPALVWLCVPGLALAQREANPLDTLHQALHLAPAQESAWAIYRGSADSAARAGDRRRAAQTLFARLDSPHRVDLIAAEMRAELADLEREGQAVKALYAVLSPEQRRVFDQRTLPPQDDQQY